MIPREDNIVVQRTHCIVIKHTEFYLFDIIIKILSWISIINAGPYMALVKNGIHVNRFLFTINKTCVSVNAL